MSFFLSWKQNEWSWHRHSLTAAVLLKHCFTAPAVMWILSGWVPAAQKMKSCAASAAETSYGLPMLVCSRAWPYAHKAVCASTFLKNYKGKHFELFFGRTWYNEKLHCKKLLFMEKLLLSEALLDQGGGWGLSLGANGVLKSTKPHVCLHVKLEPHTRGNEFRW